MRRMMQIRVIHTEVNVEQGVVKGSQSNHSVFTLLATHTLTKPPTLACGSRLILSLPLNLLCPPQSSSPYFPHTQTPTSREHRDQNFITAFTPKRSHESALWLSGYSDRLEIYFLREQEFESLRRRPQNSSFCFSCCQMFFSIPRTVVTLLDDIFVYVISFDFVR